MKCPGNPGHGSRFIEGTAAEKLRRIINRFLDFRQRELNRLDADPKLTLGDVTSINLTKIEVRNLLGFKYIAVIIIFIKWIQGGVQVNVVPSELAAYFDIRVNPWTDTDEMDRQLLEWCEESGEGVTMEFIAEKIQKSSLTSIESGSLWLEETLILFKIFTTHLK